MNHSPASVSDLKPQRRREAGRLPERRHMVVSSRLCLGMVSSRQVNCPADHVTWSGRAAAVLVPAVATVELSGKAS